VYAVSSAIGATLAYKNFRKISKINSPQDIETALNGAVKIRREIVLARPFLRLSAKWRTDIKLLDKIVDLKPVVTELLGLDGEKTFLLVFQNNVEMRPSGGIWGSYGIAKVKDSQIVSIVTDDTYNIDKSLIGQYPPPEEVKDIFKNEWRFWNANWSPDFKKSVEQGLYFYRQVDPNIKFDGVIGPNIDYVLSLLEASGPIGLKGHNFTLDKDNFLQKMVLEPMSPASAKILEDYVKDDEKNYVLADIGQELINKLVSAGQTKAIVSDTYNALGNKDLQLYFAKPALQAKLEKYDWAGRMPTGGNFAMLVDANLGSKLDFMVEKKMKIEGLGDGRYRTTITYKNTLDAKDKAHVFKVYRDYVRLYLPKGSKLVEQKGGQLVSDLKYDKELDSSYIPTLLVLKPGESDTVTTTWEVPVSSQDQLLQIIKQSGSHIRLER
jgi:hypothetical protein